MARILSKAEREKLEKDLAAAMLYTEDEIRILDREEDFDRLRATIAKKLLEMADENERDME